MVSHGGSHQLVPCWLTCRLTEFSGRLNGGLYPKYRELLLTTRLDRLSVYFMESTGILLSPEVYSPDRAQWMGFIRGAEKC